MQKQTFAGLAMALATAGIANAQDECSAAATVMQGMTAFDTTTATLSAEPWNCAMGGAADLWYSYTATSSGDDVSIDTCGSGYDTAIEVYDGTCAALNLIECNDDACALQSRVIISGGANGTTYLIRVGGWNGTTGAGTLTIGEAPPVPLPPNCVETTYLNNNGGGVGGAIYFDLTLANATTINGIETNYSAALGSPVGVEVYTTPGTYAGNEANMGVWTLAAMDDGTATSEAAGTPTPITFASPLSLPAGTVGIALVAVGSAHAYTNGTGLNENHVSADGNITLDLGSATNVPFTGAPFMPRVWNGRICSGGPSSLGTNYCTAVANSTGSIATVSATGSAGAAANNFTLMAADLPNNQFGIFVTSMTQGFVPGAGGTSNGNLCLGGALGRFTQPSQILSTRDENRRVLARGRHDDVPPGRGLRGSQRG